MRKKYRSIIIEYFAIYLLMLLVIAITCIFSVFGIIRTQKDAAAKEHAAKLSQVKENLDDIDRNSCKLISFLASNEVLTGMLEETQLSNKLTAFESFKTIVRNLADMNSDVIRVNLYDLDAELVASSGGMADQQFSNEHLMNNSFRPEYITAADSSYYGVVIPVMKDVPGSKMERIGTAVLILDLTSLQEQLTYLTISGGYAELSNGNNEIIWAAGKEACKTDKQILTAHHTLTYSGWHITYYYSENSFAYYESKLLYVTIFAYALILLIMAFHGHVLYRKMLLPVKKLRDFVAAYPEDITKRGPKDLFNEIGELSESINHMLDELEHLTAEKIQNHKSLLDLEYEKKKTEMLAYKSQINPHFMYNTLDCIQGIALYKKENEIAKLTSSLSKLFRYNVKGNEYVTLSEATRNLEEYALILSYRFMGRISISISLDPSLKNQTIPKMLLQPLVENAVIHGLENKLGYGCVNVTIHPDAESDFIRFTIHDNGVGIPAEKLSRLQDLLCRPDEQDISADGIGLQNVAKRIRLFYGDAAVFTIASVPGQETTVTLLIPKRDLYEAPEGR